MFKPLRCLVFGIGLAACTGKPDLAKRAGTLVDRAYACKTATCARDVLAELNTLVASDDLLRLNGDDITYITVTARARIQGRVDTLSAPAEPPSRERLKRRSISQLGLGLCTYAYEDPGAHKDEVGHNIKLLASLAEIPIADPPALHHDGHDLQRLDDYRLGTTKTIMAKLATYPESDSSLALVQHFACSLYATPYSNGAEHADLLDKVVTQAKLDRALVAGVVAAVRKKAPVEEVRTAVDDFRTAVDKALTAEADATP